MVIPFVSYLHVQQSSSSRLRLSPALGEETDDRHPDLIINSFVLLIRSSHQLWLSRRGLGHTHQPAARILKMGSLLSVLGAKETKEAKKSIAAEEAATAVTINMADRVHRVTMFKLPDLEEQRKLIEQYQILGKTHKKVGRFFSAAWNYRAVCPRGSPVVHLHHIRTIEPSTWGLDAKMNS
jgi:hypothetical protein